LTPAATPAVSAGAVRKIKTSVEASMFSEERTMPVNRTKWPGLCRVAVATAIMVSVNAAPVRALTAEEILNYKGPDRQKFLEEGARKEGTVVIYSGMIVNQLLRPLTEAFQKKYPFVQTRYWRGDSNQIIAKVNAEVRANALVADVVEGSGISGGVGESQVVMPFYSPLFEDLPKEDIAPDRTWAATRFRYIAVGYNTKYISKDEAPKNYDDLLNPKWKGKMAWRAASDASGALVTITSLLATWGEQKTEAYIAKLAKQEIASLSVSNRQVVDQVIQGEYWIGIGISAHHPVISSTQGAPSATVLFDPIPSLNDSVQVLKGTKHPHAAMLLVDFMLSTEAQRMLQDAEYFPSNPNVDPAPSLKMLVPKNAGVPAAMLTPELLDELTPKSVALYKKYFR
jgi:iron(III) transport system substrate-binding protein